MSVPPLGGGGIHMALQCVFGGDQAFRNQCLPIGEALARYWHRNSDGVAERIVEGDADGANAKSVFFTIVRNTVPARRL
jgi:hypothetical protein